MGFWDKVKSLFGGGGGGSGLDAEIDRRIAAGKPFAARELGAVADVEPLLTPERLDAAEWTRTRVGGEWVYHPQKDDPSAYGTATAAPPPAGAGATRVAPAKAAATPPASPKATASAKVAPNAYDASGIRGLDRKELRARALKIDPYKTAWIGRVDTIPPTSDERTALIDRGLVLRGLLDEEKLAEIHRVGDIWIRHHDAVTLANAVASRSAEAAVQAERKKKRELKEQKQKEARERAEKRAMAIARRRAEDIVFLGRGVSERLDDRRSNIEELGRRGVPVLSSPADVARALGLAIPRLRWLCFHAEAATRTHYVYFEIPKRSGGTRLLAAPHAELSRAQHWVLSQVLEKLEVGAPAHGFVKGRSTVSNARAHTGKDVVVNLDLKDFFPSITFFRARGVFEGIGYSPAVATVLALLCTESPRVAVDHDGERLWVATGERALPQGACTSPALSNQIARKLDLRLAGMAKSRGWTYTRYADDLSFSAPAGHREEIGRLLARVRHVAEEEGFSLNPKKGRVLRAGGRQEVTGVVVNDKLGVPREEVRRLRAILHGAKKTGLEAQNREQVPHFEAWLRGKIAYVMMIDRPKGESLRVQLDALVPGRGP